MDQTGLLMVWEDQEPPAWEPAAHTVNQKAPEKTGFHTLILAQYIDLFIFSWPLESTFALEVFSRANILLKFHLPFASKYQ